MSKKIWIPVVITIMVVGGGASLIHKEGQVFDQKFLSFNDRLIASNVQVETAIVDRHFLGRDVTVKVVMNGQSMVIWQGKVKFGWGVTMALTETGDSPLSERLKAMGIDHFKGQVEVNASPIGGKVVFDWKVDPLALKQGGLTCSVGPSNVEVTSSKKGVDYAYRARDIVCDEVSGEHATLKSMAVDIHTVSNYGFLTSSSSKVKLGALVLDSKILPEFTWKSATITKALSRHEGSKMNFPLYDVDLKWKVDQPQFKDMGRVGLFSGEVIFERLPQMVIYNLSSIGLSSDLLQKKTLKALRRSESNILFKDVAVETLGDRSFANGEIRYSAKEAERGHFAFSVTPKSWRGFTLVDENLEQLVSKGVVYKKNNIYSLQVPLSQVYALLGLEYLDVKALEEADALKAQAQLEHAASTSASSSAGHAPKKGH